MTKSSEKKLLEFVMSTLNEGLQVPVLSEKDIGYLEVFYGLRTKMQEMLCPDDGLLTYQLLITRERDKAEGKLEAIQEIQNTMIKILNDEEEN